MSIKDVGSLVFRRCYNCYKTERSIDAEEYEDNLPVKAAASHEYKFVKIEPTISLTQCGALQDTLYYNF